MNQLAKAYFDWLYERVFGIRDVDTSNCYTIICNYMLQFPFKYIVPHDDNRIADGTMLRDEFLRSYKRRYNEIDKVDMIIPDATIFEVLVGLAARADFILDHGEEFWFDLFLTNLQLKEFNDRRYVAKDNTKIERRLRRFNDRRYQPDGTGGIFPLKDPQQDQREVELWYQMAAYMTENQMY
jgi:hypothetical protein